MPYMLKLPDERGAQLKMIAKHEGRTAVDVVSDMIRAKLAEHALSADLPGVTVTRSNNKLRIEMPGFEGEVSASDAAKLADSLRDAGALSTPVDRARKQRMLEGLGAVSGIMVERMAQGVRLVSPVSDKKCPLTFGVAADLADQIDRAVK